MLPKKEQILNIAAEVSRAQTLLDLKDEKEVEQCFERALELLSLTTQDQRWRENLGSLLRLQEALGYFYQYKGAPILCQIFYDWLVDFANKN